MKTQMLFETNGFSDEGASTYPSGKDEMNFAEFPIALLTDRVPKGQKSIRFEDTIYDERRKRTILRRRIIEGSEEYGLPTATDDAVILALIQLTKLKSDFRNREVEFTRLELIKMLGWADEGKNFDRIKLSLLRIANVTYNYDNAWWDIRQKTWTTKVFHILDTVEINDSRASASQGALFPSRIVWGEVVFDSFQAGFLRNLDFQLCMRLEHPTALRMYRFLGKRFYKKPNWVFCLKEFAHDHLCLGRNYEGGSQIARKLQPAIEELETAGFLEPLSEAERFIKKGREWSIRFVQKSPPPSAPLEEPKSPQVDSTPLMAELTRRGVTATTAAELVQQYPSAFISGKIEEFDWEMVQPKPPKKPAGYLVTSIREGYAVDPNFVSAAERQRQAEAKRQAEHAAAEARRRQQEIDREERRLAEQVKTYRQSRTPEQLAQLEADAIAQAKEETRQSLDDPAMKPFRKSLISRLTSEHIARLIQVEAKQEEPA